MQKLLIAGGSHSDIPLIKAGKELGFYVITTGNRADDLGHEYSDLYIKADFSDKKAMLDIARAEKISAICPCANDFSALSSAFVAEKLKLAGHDSYEVCHQLHHKDEFRKLAEDIGVCSPKAQSFTDSAKAINVLAGLSFPLVVKPVDLTGGKGVAKVYAVKDAVKAIGIAFSASCCKRIVIEQFIEGSNHGFSALIKNNKVVFYFHDDEYYYLNKYLVSGATAPGDAPSKVLNSLIKDVEKISRHLDLTDGIFHLQFIINNDKAYIIDVCRRPPGDLYIQLVKIATGVDYPKCIVRSFSGLEFDDMKSIDNSAGFFTRHCVMPAHEGVVKDVRYDMLIQDNIIDELMWWEQGKGQNIGNHLIHKLGIVFLHFSSYAEMRKKTPRLSELIKVIMH